MARRPRGNATPQDTLRNLHALCHDEADRYTITKYWDLNTTKSEICILKNGNKFYTLKPSIDTLEHLDDDNEDDTGLFTLIADPTSDPDQTCRYEYQFDDVPDITDVHIDHLQAPEVFSIKSSNKSANQLVECVFVALGWLAEHEIVETRDSKTQDKMRTTNYVVLLNLSTKPTSIWLVYDYHIVGYLEAKVRYTNKLGKDHNPLCTVEPPFVSQVKDVFHRTGSSDAGSDSYKAFWSFRTNQTNLQALRPRKPEEQIAGGSPESTHTESGAAPSNRKFNDLPSGNAAVTEPSPEHSSPSSSHASSGTKSSRARSNSTSASSVSESSDCGCNMASGHSKGFFGLHPFDIALLATDVAGWSSDGLNLEHAKKCLDYSHFRLGSSLRAKYITNEQLEVFKAQDQHVNIQDLCS